MPDSAFAFLDPGPLVASDLLLEVIDRMPGDAALGWLPAYLLAMRYAETGAQMGHIDLRIGMTPRLLRYGGNIGYCVSPEYRGHSYAARSCRLLLPLARAHGMSELWITCDAKNVASRRTSERAGAELVDTVPLLIEDDPTLYEQGRRLTCRYRIRL